MKYFEMPTQVVFADINEPGCWNAGIAYKDEIICACCGGVFSIEEIYEYAEAKIPIYPYNSWVNISAEIVGEELPDGLTISEYLSEYVDQIECDSLSQESEDQASAEYEQHYFLLEEEEESQATATFANTWVDGVAMPSVE